MKKGCVFVWIIFGMHASFCTSCFEYPIWITPPGNVVASASVSPPCDLAHTPGDQAIDEMLHTSVPLPTQGLATRERGLPGPDDELIVLDGDDDELIVLDGDGAAGPVVRENPTSSPPSTKGRATRRRSRAPPAIKHS